MQRHLSTHPAFVPALSLLAVCIALVSLPGLMQFGKQVDTTRPASESTQSAHLANKGTIAAISRTAGQRVAVSVLVRGEGSQPVRLLLSVDSRVAIASERAHVLGGSRDLAPGQKVSFSILDGGAVEPNATIEELWVTPTRSSPGTDV